MMNSISEKTKKSLYWQTIIQPIWEVIRFCLSIWIARILDPRDYGIMGVASIIILYSNSLSELGFSNALIHKTDISDHHVNTVFTINLCISVFLTTVVYLTSNFIANFFHIQELGLVLRVLSIIFILTSFSQISITLLRKKLEYKKYTIITFIKSLIQIVITLYLALCNYQYWSLIIGTVLSEMFNTIVLLYAVKFRPKVLFQRKAFNSLFNYGIWNFVIAQFASLYTYAEKAIIGKYLGASLLGFYDKAFSTAYMPVDSISMKINGVMFSSFNQYKNDKYELCNAFYNVTILSTMICFPMLGGLIVVAHDFVAIAYGVNWLPMVSVLQILSFAFVFRVVIGLMNSLIMAVGEYKKYIKVQLMLFSIAIIFYYPIVKYGISAIGLIIVLTNVILFLTAIYFISKNIPEFSLKKYIKSLMPASLNTILMVLILVLIKVSEILNLYSQKTCLIIQIFLGIIFYLILFFIIKYKNTEIIRNKLSRNCIQLLHLHK